MQLQLQTFTALVASASAAVQGAARAALDLTVGSTLRAILEANAATALWLQWLIVQVLQMTRAATSTDADLDSWVADFGMQRLQAVPAAGHVAFARFSAQGTARIPVGIAVRTADGAQSFAVLADRANPAFAADAGANVTGANVTGAYIMGEGIAALTVPVQALVAGPDGNVQAGTISLIAAAVPGVDTVSNPLPCTGGLAVEPDAALRDRFRNFIASRARATPVAIAYAIASVQQGLRATIQENVLPDLTPRMGSILITLDDGTGAPPDSLLASVATAVEAVRPAGTSFAVLPPAVLAANIHLTITVAGVSHDTAALAVSAAIAAWISTLPIGASLPYSRLAQLAYDAHPTVANVTAVMLNGGTADLVAPAGAVVRAGTIVVV
jgi:uncharacterized phage protein gp47/JayE